MAKFPRISAKRVVITFHSLGDVDAVGASIALGRFLGKKAIIAAPDRPTAAARLLMKHTGTEITMFSDLRREKGDYIVLLDSSSPALLPHLAGIEPDLMVDHHARRGKEVKAKKEIVDPSASSTCEMLHFLLKPTDPVSCIALLCGIISDSASFQNASSRTFQAVANMTSLSGLSYSQLAALSHSPESLSERIESLRSCQSVSAERIGDHIVAVALAKSHEAHFSDMLLHLGADISFVGCEGAEGRISARMRDSLSGKVHLVSIMSEAGRLLGGNGSGHECAAGASGSGAAVRETLSVCRKLAEQQLLACEKNKIRKIEW